MELNIRVTYQRAKNFVRGHKAITAIIALVIVVALPLLWSLSASIRGDIAARVDVRRGRYQVLGYGLPARSRPEYARCLRERYNIEYRSVAGCIVSHSLISYIEAYHRVTAAAAQRKFGHDVFQECAEEAEQKWNVEHEAGGSEVR